LPCAPQSHDQAGDAVAVHRLLGGDPGIDAGTRKLLPHAYLITLGLTRCGIAVTTSAMWAGGRPLDPPLRRRDHGFPIIQSGSGISPACRDGSSALPSTGGLAPPNHVGLVADGRLSSETWQCQPHHGRVSRDLCADVFGRALTVLIRC